MTGFCFRWIWNWSLEYFETSDPENREKLRETEVQFRNSGRLLKIEIMFLASAASHFVILHSFVLIWKLELRIPYDHKMDGQQVRLSKEKFR